MESLRGSFGKNYHLQVNIGGRGRKRLLARLPMISHPSCANSVAIRTLACSLEVHKEQHIGGPGGPASSQQLLPVNLRAFQVPEESSHR